MSVYNGTNNDLGDLDIIQEVITEDRSWCQNPSSYSLPGPAPPPQDLLQNQNQNHRMPRQNPAASPPVLVARGTASRPPCSFPQPQQPQCSTSISRDMAAPNSGRGATSSAPARRGRGAVASGTSRASAGPPSQASPTDTELLELILEKPKLVVTEEPKERGMRFRYECEGRSAGSILGASSTETKKTLPAIELQCPVGNIKKATITVSLVTKDFPHRPHPHCLVGKDCAEGSGICVVSLKPQIDRHHSFSNLGIQCVRRKELDASLKKRRSQNIDPFKTGHSKSIEDMDMNAVRLCFQCELEWEDGRKDSLNPVLSNPVYDKKATTTSELKINRLNVVKGPCTGKTEIYMLCDKVQKDDIDIVFKRGSWEAKAEFAQTDVHRQIAIVFKSPPYEEQNVTGEVEVSVFLRRHSDHMDSEPVSFTYLPPNPDPYEVKRKRKIKTDISLTSRSCVAAQGVAAADPSTAQPFEPFLRDMPLMESRPTPAEVAPIANPEAPSCPAPSQPGSSTMAAEFNYGNLLGQSYDQEFILLTQIIDNNPSIMSMFQDSNSFPHTEENFAMPGQDFSMYSDLTFNQLVNENQPLPAPEDNQPHLQLVKMEEEQRP
ncbi:transcription factor RelB [Aplochiton taeniatus]